jgi:hypothetical protein
MTGADAKPQVDSNATTIMHGLPDDCHKLVDRAAANGGVPPWGTYDLGLARAGEQPERGRLPLTPPPGQPQQLHYLSSTTHEPHQRWLGDKGNVQPLRRAELRQTTRLRRPADQLRHRLISKTYARHALLALYGYIWVAGNPRPPRPQLRLLERLFFTPNGDQPPKTSRGSKLISISFH